MLGERIKTLRKAKNLTQADLANALNSQFNLKVDRVMVSKWETGFQTPVMYTVTCIAKVLGVSVDYLSGDKSYISNNSGTKIPVLGYVRAGIPIEAIEEIIDYEEISQELASNGEYFGLKIKGDSMEPKFSDGDVVIVKKQETVDNGQIAVILVNGNEGMVKKFYRSEKGITLVSTNPKYDPFDFSPSEVNSLPIQIVGRVVELRAKF